MLHNILLKAGLYTEITKQGKFINVVLAAGEVRARIRMLDESTFETLLVSGMSFPVPQGYKSVALSSDINQQTKIWLGNLPLTYTPLDTKLVGSTGLDTATAKAVYNQPTELLPAKIGRGKVTISALSDIYIGGQALTTSNGIMLAAGERMSIATQAQIMAFTTDETKKEKTVIEFNDNLSVLIDEIVAAGGSVEGLHYSKELDKLFYKEGTLYKSVLSDLVSQKTTLNITKVISGEVFEENGFLYVLSEKNTNHNIAKIDMSTGVVSESEVIAGENTTTLAWQYYNGKILILQEYLGVQKLFYGDESGCNQLTVTGLTSNMFRALIMPDNTIIALTRDNTVRSMDGGVTWDAETPVPEFAMGGAVLTVDKVEGAIYATGAGRLYKSIDNAKTWLLVATFSAIDYVKATGGYLYVAYQYGGSVKFQISTNSANSFTLYDGLLANEVVMGMAIADSGALYISTNNKRVQALGGIVKKVGGLDVAIMAEVN